MDRIKAIQERRAGITSGKWEKRLAIPYGRFWRIFTGRFESNYSIADLCHHLPEEAIQRLNAPIDEQSTNDADFIANAPADIDFLLAELKKTEVERDDMANACHDSEMKNGKLEAERERLVAVVEADAKLITQLQKFKCGLTSHAGADELKKRERTINECGRIRKEALAALEKEGK